MKNRSSCWAEVTRTVVVLNRVDCASLPPPIQGRFGNVYEYYCIIITEGKFCPPWNLRECLGDTVDCYKQGEGGILLAARRLRYC